MVRLREVTIIKDPSLLNEKIGMFKIRKLLPLALGGMLGYGMIRKGLIDDVIVGIIVIVASVVIALAPDKSLNFENQLQAMAYFYTLKSKGVRMSVQPTTETASAEGSAQIPQLKPEELELKITELKQKVKEEKDLIKKMKLKRELLNYEFQYYTNELASIEQKIQQLKAKMKTVDRSKRSRIAEKLKELNRKRSEMLKVRNKINADLKKFEKVTLIENDEINQLKKKIEELKKQIENTTDKKKLKELKKQYNNLMLDYYNKKIMQNEAILRLTNDKLLKSKVKTELKELYKKKKELEKKLKEKKGGKK